MVVLFWIAMVEVIIHVRNGKVLNMAEFRAAFAGIKDGKHLVTVKDIRRRSVAQNSYYWGVVVPMVRRALYESGFDEIRTAEDAHEALKYFHLRTRVSNKEAGEVIEITGSTKELNIPEFNDYLERICRWAAEYMGIVIPSPNEELAEFDNWVNDQTSEAEK